MRKHEARVSIKSHQSDKPRFELNVTLNKRDAQLVLIYAVQLRDREDRKLPKPRSNPTPI